MPAPEFLFAITLSGEGPDHEMLMTDIMRTVLGKAGVRDGDIERLLQDLRGHLVPPPGPGCHLRLQANGDEVLLVVSAQGREWRTACPIPD